MNSLARFSQVSWAVLSLYKFNQVSSSVLHHRKLKCFSELRVISRIGCTAVFQLQNLATDFLDTEMAAVTVTRF